MSTWVLQRVLGGTGSAVNTDHLRNEGLTMPRIYCSLFLEWVFPTNLRHLHCFLYVLNSYWSCMTQAARPNLHDPSEGRPSQGSLWLPELLVSNPFHWALLACLVCVPTVFPEPGIWRGWAHILFIFVPLRPSSLSQSSLNIYKSAIFNLYSEIRLQCHCFWILLFIYSCIYSFIHLYIYVYI